MNPGILIILIFAIPLLYGIFGNKEKDQTAEAVSEESATEEQHKTA